MTVNIQEHPCTPITDHSNRQNDPLSSLDQRINGLVQDDVIIQFFQLMPANLDPRQMEQLTFNNPKIANIPLSQEALWIKRAFKNDCTFSDEEYNRLNLELKTKIFYIANSFANDGFVKKLKNLGMNEDLIFWIGPSIFARNMDIVTAGDTIENFVNNLRSDGLLLSEEEFDKLDHHKYIMKSDQIGRILGKNFIEKVVRENGLKHIKVPKKFVVLDKKSTSISFHVNRSLELVPRQGQMKVYAERIESVNRKLSIEEAVELMIVLEKTGYSDFSLENLCFGEDCIYFIDTEYTAFSPSAPQFDKIKSISKLLNPQDVPEFLVKYNERKEAYGLGMGKRPQPGPYKHFIVGYSPYEFTFKLNPLQPDLLSSRSYDWDSTVYRDETAFF